jgi:hypothetical protein
VFPTKVLYAFLNALMRATYFAHLISLDLITVMILIEAYKL